MDAAAVAKLTPKQYLERFDIDFFLDDALCAFLCKPPGERPSAPEFVGNYFDAVLRGEHVLRRDFAYIIRTTLNRRAFVGLLRKSFSAFCVSPDAALTARDFHDLAKQLCDDFPLDLIDAVTGFAEKADAHCTVLGEHLMDQSMPSTSFAQPEIGVPLLKLSSLLRLVEFAIVYSEALAAIKRFISDAPPLAPPPTRASLATLLSGLEPGAAPSYRELAEFTRARPGTSDVGSVTLREAVVEMAQVFELAPWTSDDLLKAPLRKLEDPCLHRSGSNASVAETGTVSSQLASSGPSRRRERKHRGG